MSAFRRAPAAKYAADFAHHAAGVARLNNGSFGGSPRPVLDAEAALVVVVDDDDDDEDEDEDMDEDEDEEEEEEACPPGCDPALYDKVCELREKRLEQEEVYTEFQKGVEAQGSEAIRFDVFQIPATAFDAEDVQLPTGEVRQACLD